MRIWRFYIKILLSGFSWQLGRNEEGERVPGKEKEQPELQLSLSSLAGPVRTSVEDSWLIYFPLRYCLTFSPFTSAGTLMEKL